MTVQMQHKRQRAAVGRAQKVQCPRCKQLKPEVRPREERPGPLNTEDEEHAESGTPVILRKADRHKGTKTLLHLEMALK